MLTINKILENNSEENSVYITTYSREQFDDFMRLLENQRWKWVNGQIPTDNYNNITDEINEALNEKYKFAKTTIIIINLTYSDRLIAGSAIMPNKSITNKYYEFLFNEQNTIRIIKPYFLLKKEIKEASDYVKC